MLLSSHIRKLNNVFSQFLQVSSYIFVDDVSCDIVHNRPFRGGVAASLLVLRLLRGFVREKNDSSLTSATFSGKQATTTTEEQQKQFSHQYLMPGGL